MSVSYSIYEVPDDRMPPSNLELDEIGDYHENQERTPLKLNENPNYVTDGYRKRLWLFVKERKKAILFRCLALVGIGFDIYSVVKKCFRGHYVWVGLSIFFLIVTRVFGCIYSLFCEVVEIRSQSYLEGYVNTQVKKAALFHITPTSGFATDKFQYLDYESEEQDETSSVNNEAAAQLPNTMRTHTERGVAFNDNDSAAVDATAAAAGVATVIESPSNKPRKRKLNRVISLHGSHIEPEFVDLKQISISLEQFFTGVKRVSLSMKLSHVLLLPQEYHFCRTSRILWGHYKESYHKEAIAALNEYNVKKVAYRILWNKYCFRKIISKQLSLLMATVQTIPSTLMELLYWSVLSAEISELGQNSFVDISSYGGDQFNIFELGSLLINVINISYRLVSLMKQVRKMNFLKQDMTFIHKCYLAVLYFLLLSTRILSLYLVMCLNMNGLMFTVFLLLYQLIITVIVSWNLNEEGNRVTMVVSTLMMLFVYVPPKSGKRIAMSSYYLLMLFEMIGMCTFGCYQLTSDPTLGTSISFLGHAVSTSLFYITYGCLFVVFVVSWILSLKRISKCLFEYRDKMEVSAIKEALESVNSEFDTHYELLTRLEGNAFSSQHTIDLY